MDDGIKAQYWDKEYDELSDEGLDVRYEVFEDAVKTAWVEFFLSLEPVAKRWDIDTNYIHDSLRKDSVGDALDEYVRKYGWPVS